MEANKLYKRIISLVYNVILTSKLRKEMVTNLELRTLIINQLNNLLGLEQDFKITENKEDNITLLLAQLIVNILGTEEQIEKPDKSLLSNFENDYSSLTDYIEKNFTELMFLENLNHNEDITKENILSLPEIFKSQETEILNKTESSKIDNNEEKQEYVSNKELNSNDNNNNYEDNTKSNYSGNSYNSQSFSGLNSDSLCLPMNPRLDPKFYPYKTKPKIMPNVKKVTFSLQLLISLIVIFLYVYASRFLSIQAYWNGNTKDPAFSPVSKAGFGNHVSISFPLFGGTILTPIIAITSTIILGISVFSSRNIKQEKFHISYFPILLVVFLLSYIIYNNICYSIPSIFKNNITNYYKNLKWDTTWNNSFMGGLLNSEAFKIIHSVSIALNVVILFLLITLLLIVIYNPKIDQQKIRHANYEYQKLIEAKFQGKDYKMDPSLFDDEEEKNK